MNRETLALALAFSAGLLACNSGAGNNGTSNPGGLGGMGAGGVVDTGGVQVGGSDATSCGTCSAGLVCERYPPAACADPNWNEWPLPNSQVDVAAGAPNLESYTDNGDGTVTDNVTGLMWQQAVTSYSWADAVAYCPTLTLAGQSDWRLPSMIELLSIVDHGQYNPSIDPTYFPSTPPDSFWSSSPVAGSPYHAWYVYFYYGLANNEGVAYPHYVRCVR